MFEGGWWSSKCPIIYGFGTHAVRCPVHIDSTLPPILPHVKPFLLGIPPELAILMRIRGRLLCAN
jgi:hypothetical protein